MFYIVGKALILCVRVSNQAKVNAMIVKIKGQVRRSWKIELDGSGLYGCRQLAAAARHNGNDSGPAHLLRSCRRRQCDPRHPWSIRSRKLIMMLTSESSGVRAGVCTRERGSRSRAHKRFGLWGILCQAVVESSRADNCSQAGLWTSEKIAQF
jgi:hypothetical protein